MPGRTATISSEVSFREISGETVLLNLESECFYGLDEIGTRIWQLLREKGDLRRVLDVLLQEYDVSEEQLEKDLAEFVSALERNGLLICGKTES